MPPRYLSSSSSEESSSDDSVPLAQLLRTRVAEKALRSPSESRTRVTKKALRSPSESSAFNDESDESCVSEKYGSSDSSTESSDEDGYETSDFEDLPRSSLKKSPQPRKTIQHTETKVNPTTKRPKGMIKQEKTATAKKRKRPAAPKPTKKKKVENIISKVGPNIVTPSAELYSKSLKGKLVQAVLCRWWYSYTWPSPQSIPSASPVNCDPLDGFPGIYVHTSGANVGKIIDYRDKSTCPNFINFSQKPSAELRELLITAIEQQKLSLIQSEGQESVWLNELNTLGKWAQKLNVNKADRQATRILMDAGLAL